ncbi:enamine deaminase RidA (YjgF/YER057c/UK114 family) [Streptosporangium becharense]|uniref:Enamine deaminase RidA (YjgF/YER057c/UK114 family) n=1 Tax=Streptosporangium becharense TaxID=1816182 RepID=A0A7W9MHG1_9ACTN|nr:RidA family protein [Streptosporangium becharense]MBB2912747.1 enamine deaminase RidA (YjgF/YER057c/UK114 family) [Streptosporangium becharense]MBB5820424.1 enamine deaminase RidA (YjgF/YER057c/UK114 family) [Streptosporangium becharense]
MTSHLPAPGYLGTSVFDTFAFTQTVITGDTIYLSGMTPLRGEADALELVCPGDLRGQTEFELDVLKHSLEEVGARLTDVVAVTVHTTDIDGLAGHADLFRAYFGASAPTATWVQVQRLLHPGQLVEITATAVRR